MRSLWTKWTVLVFALYLLAACGGGGGSGGNTTGGGGGSDWMTVNVVSLTTPTTTTTYTGNYTTTPALTGSVYTSLTVTQTFATLSGPPVQVNLCASGIDLASYPIINGTCFNGGASVSYVLRSGLTITVFDGTTGTVTLTSVGNQWQPITGSFDAIVSEFSAPSSTMRVWGAFSVTNF